MTASSAASELASEIKAPWPIVPLADITLPDSSISRLRRLSSKIATADSALSTDWFSPLNVTSGWADGPAVFVEDHRCIALSTEASSKHYEYRSLGLARDGDIYVVSGPRQRMFESHMREFPGFGTPEILTVSAPGVRTDGRIGKACLNQEDILYALIEAALDNGTLTFAPFYSSGDIWRLGAHVAKHANVPVRVLGSAPALTNRVNNKVWFSNFVRLIIGSESLPPTIGVYSLAKAVSTIRQLAEFSERIVVKIPSSAGAMGNVVLEAKNFRSLKSRGAYRALKMHLNTIGWRHRFPLLIGVWEQNVLQSPSAQIWIPSLADGQPIVENIFTQAVTGNEGHFIGAEVADLPEPTRSRFLSDSLSLAYALQYLGYYGRLSLDAVLIGNALDTAKIHWIEANARWGGVSIPMTISRRLSSSNKTGQLFIVQKSNLSWSPPDLRTLRQLLKKELVSLPRKQFAGAMFLLPTSKHNLSFIVTGLPAQDAKGLVQKILQLCAPETAIGHRSLRPVAES